MNELFDYYASQEVKEKGMKKAADNKKSDLDRARGFAELIARTGDGTCNSDLVGGMMLQIPIKPGPWCGSVFKGKQWEFTGERVISSRVSNHGREIKVWRLK